VKVMYMCVSGILLIGYANSQKIGKPNNLKFLEG